MPGYSSTRYSTFLAHVLGVLVVLGGCSETQVPPDPREERISLIEQFEPRKGMTNYEVEDVLGVPYFIEKVDIKGEEDGRSMTREDEVLHLGYGPFGAQTATGSHTTKYRLNLVFVMEVPSILTFALQQESHEENNEVGIKYWGQFMRDPNFYVIKVDRWYRESP